MFIIVEDDLNVIVAYRSVAKQWLYKQPPLLGNAREIQARNNKTTGLCNPFLCNGKHVYNNRGIVGNGTLYSVRAKWL
jgi:hypothetical protein